MTIPYEAPFAASTPCIDPSVGLASTNGNEGLYRRLLLMFHEGHRDAVGQVRTSLAAGDRVAATRTVHNVRTGAGTLGMMALADVTMRLEQLFRESAGPEDQVLLLLDEMASAMLPVLARLEMLRDAGSTGGPLAGLR